MPENESIEWMVAEAQDMRVEAKRAQYEAGITDVRWSYWIGAHDAWERAIELMRRAGLMEAP